MSNYSTLYTKEMYIDFGTAKTIDGFKFAYIFPNCLQGSCSSYPGPIAHTCKGNLCYKNSSNQWISAYTCPNLNVYNISLVCPMSDSALFTFAGITAREWKFEMLGNYWLGGSYQTTTYYSVKDILFREVTANYPTTQAANIAFSNVSTNQLTLNWSDGNGSKRAVFIKQDSLGTAFPADNNTYNANTVFGSGTQIGTSGWYCIYNGTDHPSGVTVTGLQSNTSYRVMVCEYNGASGAEQYNNSMGLNNPKNQKSCNQWALEKTISVGGTISILASNKDFLFVKRNSNDTIYAYSIASGNLVHKEKIGFSDFGFCTVNDKLFVSSFPSTLVYYNISNISSWSIVQTLTGFDDGWISRLGEDTTYLAWVGHWAGTYQMIDISGPLMVLKCKVNNGGNAYNAMRYGDFIYVPNAYSQSTRINVSNPNNCTISNFGASNVNGCYVTQTGNVIHDEGYSNPNRVKIYNQSNVLTGSTSGPSEVFYVLPDNYCIILDPNSLENKIYDINDGTFNHPVYSLFNRSYSPVTHTNEYLIVSNVSVVEFYHRKCFVTPVQATNIDFSNVLSTQLTPNWTDGNGTNRAVFIKQDTTGTASPVNNTTYTANTAFGSGSEIGTSGWYCVFNGSSHASGVTVTGLQPGYYYRIMVCEYIGIPGSESYNTETGTNNPMNISTCPFYINPAIFQQDSIAVCGENTVLDAGAGFSSYMWSTGSTDQTDTVNETGWYSCTVSEGICSVSDSIFVSVIGAHILQNDTTLCYGNSVTLNMSPGDSIAHSFRYIKFESFYSEDDGQVNVYEIQAYSNGQNIALNTSGFANSYEWGDWNSNGKQAIDGQFFSRWSSNRNDPGPDVLNPHFIVIDLQNQYNNSNPIDSVLLNISGFDYWNQNFNLLVSSDMINWTTIGTGQNVTGIFTYDNLPFNGNEYFWSTGDTTSSILVTPTQTTTYYCTVNNGISSCADSVTVTVSPLPAAAITYEGSPYCATGTASVTLTGQAGGTYSAVPEGLVLDNFTGEIDLSSSPAGTFTLTYAVTNGVCAVSASTSVVILPNPTASIAYPGSPYCADGTASVSQTGQGGGIYTAAPAGLTLNASTGEIDLTNSVPGSYAVTYEFTDGICYGSSSHQVIINALPIADFSVTYSYPGIPMIFTDASTSLQGSIIGWNWDFGDGTTSTLQNPVHAYISSGTFLVQLTVTSSLGCQQSVTKPVVVQQYPILNAPFTLTDSIGAQANSDILVPVRVASFNQITGISLRLDYDPAVLTFNGFSNVNPFLGGLVANSINSSPSLSSIFITWSDLYPVSLNEGSKMLDLQFTYHTGSTALTWNNTSNLGMDCEYADSAGNAMADIPTGQYYINGLVYFQPYWQLSGTLAYNNIQNTPLDSIKVVLTQNELRTDSVYTDLVGEFIFSQVPNGSYRISAFTGKPWQGVNSTDAVKIQRHFAGMELLAEPVKLQAGDVNNNSYINSTDALQVKRRFAGLTNYFMRGDWAFAKPITGGDTIIINGANLTQDFYGLCVGDVNGSNIPSTGDWTNPGIEMTSSGVIEVAQGQVFDLPVKVKFDMQVSAVSLVIPYPQELLEAMRVTMNNGEPIYNIANGEIRIAWSEINPLELNAGETLLNLRFRAKDAFTGSLAVEIRPNTESELADEQAEAIPTSELTSLTIIPLKATGISGAEGLIGSCSVYPNPAKDLVHVELMLEKTSEVTCQMFDAVGKEVAVLPALKSSAGMAQVQIATDEYSAGMYQLRITVKAESKCVQFMKKLVIEK
jgi:PKD repeat protein